MRALQIAATGMDAQQTRVEVISNNIANMSTNGYQARRAEFADLHYQTVQAAGSISSTTGTELPTGTQLGLGVRTAAVHMDVRQGALQASKGQLDIAIRGDGWFTIEMPSGETAYTRDGRFSLDADRQIVTTEGYTLGGGVTIPDNAETIMISADGQISVTIAGQAAPQAVDTIELAIFPNSKGLHALGDNLFVETAASGAPNVGAPGRDGRGGLLQGYLESSSVDVVSEITALIEAQRGYEMNSKVVTAADQMLGSTVQIR